MFTFDNIQNGDEVHQRCVLVTGHCEDVEVRDSKDAFVEVSTANEAGVATFDAHRWPVCEGWFKTLVILNPGKNVIQFTSGSVQTELVLHHVPLLQAPPLHLAIMVAKDSPLLIDCPPHKYGAVSSAHASLDAAIAKFRMTAYMWQAHTAEELRTAGLGRRSFRLEEEWAPDTLSRESHISHKLKMGSTPKVHIIPLDMTVAELRSPNLAQQNDHATQRDKLHSIFSKALKDYGGPFVAETRPVVAGMILDATYDAEKDMILAHAALGAHDPKGLSLGIFGSHLTYAWPRFIQEVPECLLDTAVPGDCVGNDNGECSSMWEACTVGQGAFLHEVGHAFSAPHSSGIMQRGYSRDWAQCFLSRTAHCRRWNVNGIEPVKSKGEHDCHWDVADMLRFRNLPHFALPSDAGPSNDSSPIIQLQDSDEADEDFTRILALSEAGFVRITFNGEPIEGPSISTPMNALYWTIDELEARYDTSKPLRLEVLTLNAKETSVEIWALLRSRSTVRVPGTNLRLHKKSVGERNDDDNGRWPWAVMLKKRSADGRLAEATKVDLRVGCSLDGAIVHYQDRTKVPCGPRGRNGNDPHMGGHQARKMAIPRGVDIVKVGVCQRHGNGLDGLRMWLSNGRAMGALNKEHGSTVTYLEPDAGQKIIGFYGESWRHGMVTEFGIVTAPAGKDLPDELYDLPELQNSPDGGSGRPWKRQKTDHESGTEGGWDTSEDEDGNYDNDSDDEE